MLIHTMSERRWLILVFALYGLLAFAYSLLMPTWEAPDETAHYLVVWFLTRNGEMPTSEQTYEAIQPPAYYWLATWVFRGLEAIDPELTRPYRPPVSPKVGGVRYLWTAENYRFLWAAQTLRWLNIPVAGLALWFIYQAARQFTSSDSPIPLATITLIGLTPQFLHNAASISNDPLANLVGAFLFWLIGAMRLEIRDWRLPSSQSPITNLLLVTVLAFCFPFVIKLTILPMSLAVITAVGRQIWSRRTIPRPWLALGGGMGGMAVVAGIAALATRPDAALLWRTTWWRISSIRPDFFTNPRWPLWRMVSAYISGYWGKVGWEAVSLPAVALVGLTALAGVGWLTSLRFLWPAISTGQFWRRITAVFLPIALLWFLVSRWNSWWAIPWQIALCVALVWVITYFLHKYILNTTHHAPRNWWLVWLTVVFALLIIVKNTLTTPQYQGRFLFPVIGPLTLLMVTGWDALLPRRTAVYLPHLILVVMLLLNLWLWFYGIIPTYYQPFLDG